MNHQNAIVKKIKKFSRFYDLSSYAAATDAAVALQSIQTFLDKHEPDWFDTNWQDMDDQARFNAAFDLLVDDYFLRFGEDLRAILDR